MLMRNQSRKRKQRTPTIEGIVRGPQKKRGCLVQWRTPLHGTFHSSQIFPTAFFSLPFTPVKSCSSFIAQMEGQLPFSFSPNQTSIFLFPLNGQGLCGTHHSHQMMTLFSGCAEYLPAGLSIKAAFPLLHCDSLNTKLWSDMKDKGVLWQK